MVNKIVLEYLRVNKGNYKLEDLKKKILASGYTQKDIDDALVQLNVQSQGNAPGVDTTIKKINKINIPVQTKSITSATEQKPKKSKKWLWIILGIILLVLILIGGGVWYFWDKISGLF